MNKPKHQMSGIKIESPGLLSTIQDLGRYGYQRYGMPVSGAMDGFALGLANRLVGNKPDAAGIEATLMGPSIRFLAGGLIALCGSGMQGVVDGSAIASCQAFAVEEGDLLHFEPLPQGCRMYVAFAGGVDVPPVMGSRSTCLRAGIGGHKGRALRKGDVLSLGRTTTRQERKTELLRSGKTQAAARTEKRIPPELIAAAGYGDSVGGYGDPIRIIPGPEVGRLDSKGVISLLSTEYRVSGQSDRMGYRLEGDEVSLRTPTADIISAGIAMGTIQVTGSGQPIIMMADRQTTGGYARVAVVASVDLGRVAQLRPGDAVSFEEISAEEARRLYIRRHEITASIFPW